MDGCQLYVESEYLHGDVLSLGHGLPFEVLLLLYHLAGKSFYMSICKSTRLFIAALMSNVSVE